jgi:hypothetical protein
MKFQSVGVTRISALLEMPLAFARLIGRRAPAEFIQPCPSGSERALQESRTALPQFAPIDAPPSTPRFRRVRSGIGARVAIEAWNQGSEMTPLQSAKKRN